MQYDRIFIIKSESLQAFDTSNELQGLARTVVMCELAYIRQLGHTQSCEVGMPLDRHHLQAVSCIQHHSGLGNVHARGKRDSVPSRAAVAPLCADQVAATQHRSDTQVAKHEIEQRWR